MNAELLTSPKFLVVVPYYENGKWDGKNWITLTKIVFTVNGKRYTIPSGFVTDFASIPRFARITINRIGKPVMAYIIHDWLRTNKDQVLPTKQCDEVLYKLSRDLGESWYTSKKVYYSLRSFGWVANVGDNKFSKVDPKVLKYICDSNNYQ
jgi:hypothetical protein